MGGDGKPVVLYVEDDPSDFELMEIAFEECDILVDLRAATNGAEAIEELQRMTSGSARRFPDLVLVDLNLPGLPGEQVLAFINESPDLRAIPTVVLSTSSAQNDRRRCNELGATDYLVKPNRFEAFLAMARHVAGYIDDC